MKWTFIIFILFLICKLDASAQENIPIGTWRTHYSFNHVNNVLEVGNAIYATSQNGLFILDREDNSLTKLTKNDGLQGGEISAINYDPVSELILLGYKSGNLDLIENFEITNLDLTTNSQIQGSKSINHITIFQGFAYLSTDFGVLKFDMDRKQVKETYRELGIDADSVPQALKVNMSAVFNDSLFIASAQGILAANLVENINLLDFNNWRRFSTDDGIPTTEVKLIAAEADRLVAAIDQQGLYFYQETWSPSGLLQDKNFKDITADQKTLITTDSIIHELSGLSISQISIAPIPTTAVIASGGDIWAGTVQNGLLNINTNEIFLVDGPLTNNAFRLNFFENKIFVAPGGFSNGSDQFNREGAFYTFSNGDWSNTKFQSVQDITECLSFDNSTFCGSFGDGLIEIKENGEQVIYNQNNSPLLSMGINPDNVRILGMTVTETGLWVLNYSHNQIHLLDRNREWQTISVASGLAAFAVDLIVAGDLLWLIIDPSSGGGIVVVDPFSGESRYLTTTAGSGGLANSSVNSLALDKQGFVWAGTATGVSVFSNPFSALNGNIDAVEPIFESRLLLQDEVITDIEVDGGDRKWISSQRGVWLFDEEADQQIRFFDAQNSPLPTSNIIDVEIDDNIGEVFFATAQGIISWRGTATEAGAVHANVEIFPNPVRQNFNGTVGISGLATNANVKVTDVSGKLIWQTRAQGGTATWRVRDYNGNRAATGIYLVFSSTEDGEDALVGKIAVVN